MRCKIPTLAIASMALCATGLASMSRDNAARGTLAVLRPDAELVGVGRRRAHLSAPQARHILEPTPHRHLLIIPGARDEVIEEGRAITVTIASPTCREAPITGCCCATARCARRSSASGPT